MTARFVARGPGWLVVLLGLVAAVTVAVVSPPHRPPLYDGLGFPDELYRWVETPPGAQRAEREATGIRVHIPVDASGSNAEQRAFSAEQGPQVALDVPQHALAVAGGSRSVTLTAVPEAAPTAPPAGTVVSNLYTIRARADGRRVELTRGHTVTVNLRADQATRDAVVLEAWDGSVWRQVYTRQVGMDIYAALLPSFGSVALVRLDPGVQPTVAPPPATSSAPGHRSAANVQTGETGTVTAGETTARIAWLVAGVVLLALGVLLARRRRALTSGEPTRRSSVDRPADDGSTPRRTPPQPRSRPPAEARRR